MEYKMGDKVVYPNHGVGIIEQISYGVLEGVRKPTTCCALLPTP